MYFKITRAGPYAYLQIAQSYREGGRTRQRVLTTLGRLDVLQETGQIERLLQSGARFSERLAVIDAHDAGETEPVAVRTMGPDLVFDRLWDETGIRDVLVQAIQGRRFGFDVERAIYLTVLHRLFVSGSDRAAEQWRENYRIPGTEQLGLHHLYRAMAFLGTPLKGEDSTLGSPRCTKDRIEEALFERSRDLFTEVDLVFFDTTSIYFEGAGGESIGQYGHSKDHRPDLKQMIVGIVLDGEGHPICCEMWPGNTTDVKTLLPVVERLKKRFRIREICVVADRGMMSAETVQALETAEPSIRYILGVRMRRQAEIGEEVLKDRGRWLEVEPERKRSKDPAPLKVKEVEVHGRRYVVCLNEEQRRKDAHDRAAIVESLRKQLPQGPKKLIGNKGYRRFVKMAGEGRFEVDERQVQAEARYDGLWILRSNIEAEAELIARAYKNLWMVEALFRTAKSILETRPIYHKCDETIRGHVFCSFLALVLKFELERRLRDRDEEWEWAEIIRGLDNLHEVEVLFSNKRYLLRSQLIGQADKALRAAGVALPPTLRQV